MTMTERMCRERTCPYVLPKGVYGFCGQAGMFLDQFWRCPLDFPTDWQGKVTPPVILPDMRRMKSYGGTTVPRIVREVVRETVIREPIVPVQSAPARQGREAVEAKRVVAEKEPSVRQVPPVEVVVETKATEPPVSVPKKKTQTKLW